jgi:hypothetical protein
MRAPTTDLDATAAFLSARAGQSDFQNTIIEIGLNLVWVRLERQLN